MSPKQLLGASELQQHVCGPVKDSWEHTEGRGQLENIRSPHRNSKTVEHLNDSRGHGSDPSTNSHHSHHQNRDKLMKSGLHLMAAHLSNDQSSRVGVYPQQKYPQYQRRQNEWQRSSDYRQQMVQGNVYRQDFYEMVSGSFSNLLCLVSLHCANIMLQLC